jgi:hypothetical protein
MQGIPTCTTVECENKPQTGLDWDCGPGDTDQTLPGFFNDTCTVACSFGFFSMMENGQTCMAAGDKEACELSARCAFLDSPGEDVEFAQTVCEVPADKRQKNFAELGFEVGPYMWTSFSDAKTADACLAKVGSTAEWRGKGEEFAGFRGLVEYVVFADGCHGYGTFYGIDDEQRHKPHDGVSEGSAAGAVRRAWYLCPVSDSVLIQLDLNSTGSNVSWKFMGRVVVDNQQVHRSFTCVLDTCPNVKGCPESFNAVEDCARSCPPGQAPLGELALAGTQEIVECRNRAPQVKNKCKPFPCKTPVNFPGVLSVDNYGTENGECGGDDIENGTTCMVNCRSLHYFFDNAYDGTPGPSTLLYPRSLPFVCNAGTFQIDPNSPESKTYSLTSSPSGVLGSEYSCLLQGSTAKTVEAVAATMGLKMPKADVKMLLENQDETIAALETGLRRAIAETEATVKVLPPLAEVADATENSAERRLQDAGESTNSILRVQFVAYSPDGSSSPAKISAALEEFRADEEAMKAQFMAALNEADLPRSVTVLGVSMSEPEVINYQVVTKPEKTVEELTRERMRDVAMLGSAVSLVVIVLCVFWSQIKPCVFFVARKLNCLRLAREFKERKRLKKLEKNKMKSEKSLQVEFAP